MPLHSRLISDGIKKPKVIILGSGALSIGQAGEFDYSGSQALKAFEEEGVQTILVNPNIATIQTLTSDKRKTYLYPVEAHWVEKIIEMERPDAIVAGFGGQTALNCVLKLDELGILKKYNVENLGTCVDTLRLTEDRELFAKTMKSIGIPIPESYAVSTLPEAQKVLKQIGYPVIIRAAYALGGLGSGFADSDDEALKIIQTALNFCPQVLIERSLRGWEELEYEVMRDGQGNVITICNMENLDPLGVHTGDSIVVAPSQTLNDDEFQVLRNASIKIVSALNIVGECNVQFALSTTSNDFYVIEVNARLSRSSALASKATGYPIAYIAAKVVAGYDLLELKNPVTDSTCAFFEPAMDYVVIKIPRWDLAKFPGATRRLGSSMKSVGEVMSIGRNFAEAIQKAVRMTTENPVGISLRTFTNKTNAELEEELRYPTDQRLQAVFESFRRDYKLDDVHNISKIDSWFLRKIEEIICIETQIIEYFKQEYQKFSFINNLDSIIDSAFSRVSREVWLTWKKYGFSDHQILFVAITRIPELKALYDALKDQKYIHYKSLKVREYRIAKKVLPVVKKIDTTAAEYPTPSNYVYVSYEGTKSDTQPYAQSENSLIILGSGAYRIGSSVEFDWGAVMCSDYIKKNNMKSIVINCNPETVSTDYSTSDKLYFEELTVERILDIYQFEKPKGIITSMGGQLPNVLTEYLDQAGLNILGHSAKSIESAENRAVFSKILDQQGIEQPRWRSITSKEELDNFVEEVGFPVLVRPSFVLSGTAMRVAYTRETLDEFLSKAVEVSPTHPVVVTEFLQDAAEIELDGVAYNGKNIISFMTEHLENAGVHSGDSALIYPAQKLYVETVRKVKQAGALIAKELNLNGPFNIQFLAQSNKIKVIECNARASRSFPFISKITGINLADLATRVFTANITGKTNIDAPAFDEYNLPHVGVKAPMFSFARLDGADPILGVEMYSTGEVGCIGNNFEEALLLSLGSTGIKMPTKGILVSAGRLREKIKFLNSIHILKKLGIPLYATTGTAKFLKAEGIDVVEALSWQGQDDTDLKNQRNVLTAIQDGIVDLIINIPKNLEPTELKNGAEVRKLSKKLGLMLITNSEMAAAFFDSLENYHEFMTNHKPMSLLKMNS